MPEQNPLQQRTVRINFGYIFRWLLGLLVLSSMIICVINAWSHRTEPTDPYASAESSIPATSAKTDFRPNEPFNADNDLHKPPQGPGNAIGEIPHQVIPGHTRPNEWPPQLLFRRNFDNEKMLGAWSGIYPFALNASDKDTWIFRFRIDGTYTETIEHSDADVEHNGFYTVEKNLLTLIYRDPRHGTDRSDTITIKEVTNEILVINYEGREITFKKMK